MQYDKYFRIVFVLTFLPSLLVIGLIEATLIKQFTTPSAVFHYLMYTQQHLILESFDIVRFNVMHTQMHRLVCLKGTQGLQGFVCNFRHIHTQKSNNSFITFS